MVQNWTWVAVVLLVTMCGYLDLPDDTGQTCLGVSAFLSFDSIHQTHHRAPVMSAILTPLKLLRVRHKR